MPDLSDFGGGVDHDPGPEDEVRLHLSKWLRDAGADVYWDRDHSYGWGTFDPGTTARPDLLIDGQQFTYAVEVKPGEDGSRIHDAFPQIVNYWESVVSGDAEYRINGKSVDIDGFLLATGHSPNGRLYPGDGESDVIRTGTSEGRQQAVAAGQLPVREFNATERSIRVMWRFSKDRLPNSSVGIGALLSSRLDGDDAGLQSSKPAALFKSHAGMPNGASQRYQWWEYIPFYQKPD
jgi:hypothetical protein